jgi:hypothetical protein
MWRYLQGGFAHGPVSSPVFSVLIEQGIVAPATPVSNGGQWIRAGEVAELYPSIASDQLGEPICGGCGGRLNSNGCPVCNLLLLESTDSTPAKPKADDRYPDLRRYLALLASVAEMGFALIACVAILFAVLNGIQSGVGVAVISAAITVAVAYLMRLGIMASVQVIKVLLDIEAHTRRLAGWLTMLDRIGSKLGTPIAPITGIMEPATVKCDKCGTRALVHDVHFEYTHADLNGLPAAKHEVKAVIRDVDCPECGRRKQYQTFIRGS